MKKYKLTEETITHYDKTLYRIESLKDFSNVKEGDLGGYVEKEDNLSHEGNCWVSGNACITGNTIVSGNTYIYDEQTLMLYICKNTKLYKILNG